MEETDSWLFWGRKYILKQTLNHHSSQSPIIIITTLHLLSAAGWCQWRGEAIVNTPVCLFIPSRIIIVILIILIIKYRLLIYPITHPHLHHCRHHCHVFFFPRLMTTSLLSSSLSFRRLPPATSLLKMSVIIVWGLLQSVKLLLACCPRPLFDNLLPDPQFSFYLNCDLFPWHFRF